MVLPSPPSRAPTMAASLLSTSTALAGLPSPLAMRRNCEFHTSALEPSSLFPRRCCPYVDFPVAIVKGAAGETMVNAAEPAPIEETVRSAAPTLPMVSFASLVWPIGALPKSSAAGAMTMDGCGLSVLLPESAIVRLSLTGSLLRRVRMLDAGPAAEGANRTVTPVEAPAATAKGATGETIVNAAEALEIDRTVRSALPELPTVNLESFICPTVTAPKSRDAGATEMTGAAAAPDPLREIVTVERVGSLLEMDSVPETAPPAFGEKRTITSMDCPAGIVVGSGGDTTLYRWL